EGLAPLPAELASADLREVLALDSPQLAEYTAEGTARALGETIRARKPRFVLFSHTYQVRDFAPKLAASLGCGLISDCLGYRREGGRVVFVRQVFQGKFYADVEFAGEPPWFATFQAGAFREDAVRRGAPPAKVTAASMTLDPTALRIKAGERFRAAKQAVDLTQAEIIVAVGRGIKAPEN